MPPTTSGNAVRQAAVGAAVDGAGDGIGVGIRVGLKDGRPAFVGAKLVDGNGEGAG